VQFGALGEVKGFGMTVDVPVPSSVNIASLVLTLSALLAVFRFKIGMLPVLAGCSILGLLYGMATGAI
ncbi:chromate transporter, partial [Mesorhizobium sp. M0437]